MIANLQAQLGVMHFHIQLWIAHGEIRNLTR